MQHGDSFACGWDVTLVALYVPQ